jgi:uncharacterized protein (DUF1501 family)
MSTSTDDDPTTAEVLARLSAPASTDPGSLSRRHFLQASIATAGAAALLPSWLGDTAAATPLGAEEGVLVVVLLAGGNDGLNTVVPTGTGAYYDRRRGLAVAASSALPVAPGVGLHPNLTRLKARFDAGEVAILQGVGDPSPDLSHFEAMARWMTGSARPADGTGWLGRFTDGLPGGDDPFHAVGVGTSVPLTLMGRQRRPTVLAPDTSHIFGTSTDPVERRVHDCVRAMAAPDLALGPWGDALAASGRSSVDLARRVHPFFSPAPVEGRLARQLDLCARLVNADLGVRVLHTAFGDFDTHADQGWRHAQRMTELDAGIEQFFQALDPRFADRVTLLTVSEFGRRVQVNGSGGTDHGTSNVCFAVGRRVNGGLHGAQPSITSLNRDGNLVSGTDFRSVYATVLDRWLGADPQEVLGGAYPDVGFLQLPGDSPRVVPAPVVVAPPPPPPSPPSGYLLATAAGAVAVFGDRPHAGNPGPGTSPPVAVTATPSGRGYWVTRADGAVHAFGDAEQLGSMAGRSLVAPIVGMAATPTGRGYWLLGRDGGIFSFGDAAFHGSTGGIRLNQPIVSLAAVPTGGGYWFVAADGGIFAYGPGARFFGSMGGTRLSRPVVAMAPTRTGRGYWLVASDGGVFSFGDAGFFGSTGGIRLNQPIIGLTPTPTGKGYWFVAADGGVFAFGDAPFHGSLGGASGSRVVAMA